MPPVLTASDPETARPKNRVWGQKTASGIFLGNYDERAGKNRIHPPKSHRLARVARKKSASGVRYHRNRYYNPSTGRFLSRDSTYFSDGPNMYAYGRNNPANLSDPFGTSCSDLLLDAILANGSSLVGSTILSSDGSQTYIGDGYTITIGAPQDVSSHKVASVVLGEMTVVEYDVQVSGTPPADDNSWRPYTDAELLQQLIDNVNFDAAMRRANGTDYTQLPSGGSSDQQLFGAVVGAFGQYSDVLTNGLKYACIATVEIAGVALTVVVGAPVVAAGLEAATPAAVATIFRGSVIVGTVVMNQGGSTPIADSLEGLAGLGEAIGLSLEDAAEAEAEIAELIAELASRH